MKRVPLLISDVRRIEDVVFARQRAREVAAALAFDSQDQTRLATALSEIARNAVQHGGGGRIEYSIEPGPMSAGCAEASLVIRVRDRGPGLPGGDLAEAVTHGRGLGGARRLVDSLEVASPPDGGTLVTLRKELRRGMRIGADEIRASTERIAQLQAAAQNPYEETLVQNRELLQALSDLTARRRELEQVNQELEETNRGVVALYAELDEKAEALRQASEAKSRFLSNMTHEFRTPVNSILGLTRLLLDRVDGPLVPEQEKQLQLIRRSADGLSDMINDLLDLAKVEAGKLSATVTEFELGDLFGALRGVFKPLLSQTSSLALQFDEPAGIPRLATDEGKLAQVLRNFVSNALKYTERGEIRVSASLEGEGQVRVSVSDTGIGIAERDLERVFEEFTQIDSHLQRKSKGTGLGLPLTRRLAGVLRGRVEVSSRPGTGSTFSVVIPLQLEEVPSRVAPIARPLGTKPRILIIDDDEPSRYLLKSILHSEGDYSVFEAERGADGLAAARKTPPDAVFLDLCMPDMLGFEVLRRLSDDPATAQVPVIIYSGKPLTAGERILLGSARAILSKEDAPRAQMAHRVRNALLEVGLPLRSADEDSRQETKRHG